MTRDRTKVLDPDGVDAGRPLRHCGTNRPETVIKGMSKWSFKILIVKMSWLMIIQSPSNPHYSLFLRVWIQLFIIPNHFAAIIQNLLFIFHPRHFIYWYPWNRMPWPWKLLRTALIPRKDYRTPTYKIFPVIQNILPNCWYTCKCCLLKVFLGMRSPFGCITGANITCSFTASGCQWLRGRYCRWLWVIRGEDRFSLGDYTWCFRGGSCGEGDRLSSN